MRLEDKVAIVTGSSQGIGQSVALGFAAEGAHVCVTYRSYREGGERVVQQIRDMGRRAILVELDQSQADQVERMVVATRQSLGPVDILVNNAATYPRCSWQEMSEAKWDRMLDVNLKGQFLCAHAVTDEMISRGQGKVINVSSVTFLAGMKNLTHYIASKGGTIGLTRGMARELGEFGICVNAVIPGAIMTPREIELSPDSESTYKWAMERQAIQRRVLPEDMVGAFVFLASSDSDFCTGQSINIDGGWVLQ